MNDKPNVRVVKRKKESSGNYTYSVQQKSSDYGEWIPVHEFTNKKNAINCARDIVQPPEVIWEGRKNNG